MRGIIATILRRSLIGEVGYCLSYSVVCRSAWRNAMAAMNYPIAAYSIDKSGHRQFGPPSVDT
ncbi:hypothetical protein GB937_001429 [Aspergillus fischeri]|nr:hypothetical protein GB937_001429 [Aspergillus fischeri]